MEYRTLAISPRGPSDLVITERIAIPFWFKCKHFEAATGLRDPAQSTPASLAEELLDRAQLDGPSHSINVRTDKHFSMISDL